MTRTKLALRRFWFLTSVTSATLIIGSLPMMPQGAASANTAAAPQSLSFLSPNVSLPNLGPGPFATGVRAYLYGYPLVMMGVTERVVTSVPDTTTVMGRAPVNQFFLVQGLPNASYTDVVLPSTTTLYGSAFLDLHNEPMVLHVPKIKNRFFIFQLLDAWTNVSPESPSSRIGTQEGDYAFTGPDWKGTDADLPPGIVKRYAMPTNTMWIIYRVYTSGSPRDIRKVVKGIFGKTTLTPLSSYGQPYTPPVNVPVDPTVDTKTPPLDQVKNMDACAFFGTLAALLQTNPPLPADANTVAGFKSIGLVPGQPFSCGQLNATTRAALQLAVRVTRTLLPLAPQPSPTRTGWSLPLNVGSYGTQYVLRAIIAQKALGANRPDDAVYGAANIDSKGDPLSGANQYTIHFKPQTSKNKRGELPPVNANGFWSVTLYNLPQENLYDNSINRNALGIPPVQNHSVCLNDDKSLTLYIQHDPPADPSSIAYCNWIPTPAGEYMLFLRMYWPDQVVLDGKWIPPAVKKVN
jgi:DNA sulfur modification protein DndE